MTEIKPSFNALVAYSGYIYKCTPGGCSSCDLHTLCKSLKKPNRLTQICVQGIPGHRDNGHFSILKKIEKPIGEKDVIICIM